MRTTAHCLPRLALYFGLAMVWPHSVRGMKTIFIKALSLSFRCWFDRRDKLHIRNDDA